MSQPQYPRNESQYPAYEDTSRAPTPTEYENRTNPDEPHRDIGQSDVPQPTFIPELDREARENPDAQPGLVTDTDIIDSGEERIEAEREESAQTRQVARTQARPAPRQVVTPTVPTPPTPPTRHVPAQAEYPAPETTIIRPDSNGHLEVEPASETDERGARPTT